MGADTACVLQVSKMSWALFCVFFTSSLVLSSNAADCVADKVTHAEFGVRYNCSVIHQKDISFMYRYNTSDSKLAVRIHAYSLNASVKFPVLFVVKQQLSIMSWTIPTQLKTSESVTYDYWTIGRTLCPEQSEQTAVKEIVVDVSTMNSYHTRFELVADVEDIIVTDHVSNVTVSPARSRFYRYDFPPDVWSVIVKAYSQDDLCAVFSVQDAQCPVYDMVGTVEHAGFRQTMTRRGAITVQRQTFSNASFFIVLVVKPNDVDCEKFQKIFSLTPDTTPDVLNRIKHVDIEVEQTISGLYFYGVIFITLAIFLAFYIVAAIVTLIYRYRNKSPQNEDLYDSRTPLVDPNVITYGTMADSAIPQTESETGAEILLDGSEQTPSGSNSSPSDNRRRSSSMLRARTCMCVAELSKKPREALSKKYNLYVWNLITLAIFYVLPVIQLVITYQMVVNTTGDEDICYYNFNCAYRVGFLSAFNNVYSNIGYIMLGILFILLVYRKKVLYEDMTSKRDPSAPECGIPQHFGVFYAMGIALVMEGILSGCYHVCPSFNNFQFDTAFMYMIGWLCMLKIYQTRHPDVNPHAHTAYCVIAFVVFFGVIGVTQGSPAFWIVFVIIYILCSLYLSINIYFIGQWRIRTLVRQIVYERLCCSTPRDCSRLCLLITGDIINIGFAIFGAVTMPQDFASYLLAIVIINLLMYFAFYIIMKIRCGERILLWAAIYIMLAAVVWSVALYFFMCRLTSWQLTPAMSRESNENCLLLDFYDSHDIWHFLSAISLFLSFMVLLVLEDGMVDIPRDHISVF